MRFSANDWSIQGASGIADRVAVLDGIRGIAIILVILLHLGLVKWGGLGVDIFFVLSGYLITGILLDAKAAAGAGWRVYGKPFYMRRALRIFPLALATLAVVFFLVPLLAGGDRVPLREQLWYWLYASNWQLGPRSDAAWQLGHFWSLAVEEQFYIVWPWVVAALSMKSLRNAAVILMIGALACRVAAVALHLPYDVGHAYEYLTFMRMDGLAAGALLAVLARSEGALARWRLLALIVLPIASVAYAFAITSLSDAWAYPLRYSFIAVAAGAGLVAALTQSAGLVRSMLSARWLRWIGTVSYGAYVLHLPILLRLRALGVSQTSLVVGTFGLTFSTAALSWRLFERPILSLKDRWPMGRTVRRTGAVEAEIEPAAV